MNVNITNYDISEVINSKPIFDKNHNRDVDSAKVTKIPNDIISEKMVEQEKERIVNAVTMNVNEVKDFLFMLIGVKAKSEDNSGVLINRLV